MANDTNGATDELACKHGCGDTFGNAGAKARHEQACEGGESQDGDDFPAAIHAEDLEMRELGTCATRANEREAKETVENIGFTVADGDSLRTGMAKALIRAKDGGKAAYVHAFGECEADGCEYGRNGFNATTCKRHDSQDAEATDGTDASEDTDAPEAPEATDAETERAAYVARLLAQGLSAEDAEKAASVRFDG